MLTRKDFDTLMDQGLVYRHDMERWEALQAYPGTLYPSPRRGVVVGGVPYVEELIQPALAPMRLTAQEMRQLHILAFEWERLIEVQRDAIARGCAGSEQFRSIMETVVPSAMRDIALWNSGYDTPRGPFIRLDMVRTPEGFRVVDINSTRPAGMGDQMILNAAHAANGERGTLPIEAGFCNVVRACFMDWLANRGAEIRNTPARIAVVTGQDAGDYHNFRILAEVLNRHEAWVDCAELLDEVPKPDDHRYNCVIRSRIKFGHPQFGKLLALPIEKFCVISPLGYRWIGNKRWFSYLKEEPTAKMLLDAMGAGVGTIEQAIPETGVFTEPGFVQFPDGHVADVQMLNRNDWIVKPAAGSSGKGIVIGRSGAKWRWDDLVGNPAIRGSLLQRYYRVKEPITVLNANGEPTTISCYTKYGAYLCGGKLAGVEVMARPSALVHGARDTYFTTVVDGSVP